MARDYCTGIRSAGIERRIQSELGTYSDWGAFIDLEIKAFQVSPVHLSGGKK